MTSEHPHDSALASSRLLHESATAEARFRGLIKVAPDAIVTADAGGRIVLVNGQTETLFGYQREEMLGQLVEMLLPALSRRARRASQQLHPRAAHPSHGPEHRPLRQAQRRQRVPR